MPQQDQQATKPQSLSPIITVGQNIVTAISSALQTYINVQGTSRNTDIQSATVVKTGSGRICSVSILVAGSTEGTVYDTNSTSSTSDPIYVIPNAKGLVFVNMPVQTGIVVVPGTGQAVTVSYS